MRVRERRTVRGVGGEERTYEVEHFAGHDEGMEPVHDLFDAGLVVPLSKMYERMCWKQTQYARWVADPVEVQNVDVGRPQLLEGRLEREVERLHVVPDVRRVLLDVRLPALEVRRELLDPNHSSDPDPNSTANTPREGGQRTLVAITIWSLTPRTSIHSPMNASELSSWYPFAVSTKLPPAA